MRSLILGLCAMVLFVGCTAKREAIVADWGIAQVGPYCFMQGSAEVQFNLPTTVDRFRCLCDDMIEVQKKVVKAGDSPKGWSCPVDADSLNRNTVVLAAVNARPLVETWVPAVADVLGDIALGGFIYGGLKGMQSPAMNQSVGGTGTTVFTSTFSNQPLPGLQFLGR